MWLCPAALLGLLCILQDARALPTKYDLQPADKLLHHQRRLDYHPNSRKAMANAPKVGPDQIFVTLMLKSIARWPGEGETESWVTIPLGKWLESEHVPSLPAKPISAAIISVRSKSPVRVSCQATLTIGTSNNPEKKLVTLEWVPGVVSEKSKATIADGTNLVGIGCH